MKHSESVYLAASKSDLPMILWTNVHEGNMMDRLEAEYRYRLVIPCNNGTLDMYLTNKHLYNAFYKPLRDIVTRNHIESIVTNTVTYVERGYYRYTQFIPIMRLLGKRSYKIILKLQFDINEDEVIIHPKIYHKIFIFKHKLRLLHPIKDLYISTRSNLDNITNILQSFCVFT